MQSNCTFSESRHAVFRKRGGIEKANSEKGQSTGEDRGLLRAGKEKDMLLKGGEMPKKKRDRGTLGKKEKMSMQARMSNSRKGKTLAADA